MESFCSSKRESQGLRQEKVKATSILRTHAAATSTAATSEEQQAQR